MCLPHTRLYFLSLVVLDISCCVVAVCTRRGAAGKGVSPTLMSSSATTSASDASNGRFHLARRILHESRHDAQGTPTESATATIFESDPPSNFDTTLDSGEIRSLNPNPITPAVDHHSEKAESPYFAASVDSAAKLSHVVLDAPLPETRTKASPKSRVSRLRPFRGIWRDIRARGPYYVSDWTDAWTYRVVPATLLMFCAK